MAFLGMMSSRMGTEDGYVAKDDPIYKLIEHSVNFRDFRQVMNNCGSFIDLDGHISFRLIRGESIGFQESASILPEDLRNTNFESTFFLNYGIPLTFKGIMSIEVRDKIVRLIAKKAGSSIPILIDFETECSSTFLTVRYGKRAVLFFIDESAYLFEPDLSSIIEIGFPVPATTWRDFPY